MRKAKRDRVFVVIKEPGKPPRKDVIDNRFEAFQEIIGGYYEPIRFSEDVIIICNEDGKRLDLAENSMAPPMNMGSSPMYRLQTKSAR